MSVKKTMDKTLTALESAGKKTVSVYEFVKGMSVKNKASFDLSVKSDKSVIPVWRYGFGYTKEIKVFPIVLYALAAILAVGTAMMIGKNTDK